MSSSPRTSRRTAPGTRPRSTARTATPATGRRRRTTSRSVDQRFASDAHAYLMGGAFSIADIIWSIKVLRLRECGDPFARNFRALSAWYRRVSARSGFCNSVMERNRAMSAVFRAKSAAERALQRDPELADAMISIGKVLCWHEWRFADGVRYAERAVSLSPNNAEAHWVLATALPLVGRLPEGIAAIRRALDLDPLRVEYFGWATRLLLYAKDYEAAIKQGLETFEIDEKYGRGFVFVGSTHLALGQAETALEWFQRGQSLDTAVRSYDAMIVRALAALHRREEAEEILARLENESRQQYVRAEYLAMGVRNLLIFVLLFSFLPLILVGILNTFHSRTRLRSQIRQQIETIALHEAGYLDQFVDLRGNMLDSLITNVNFNDQILTLLQSPDSDQDYSGGQSFLNESLRSNPQVEANDYIDQLAVLAPNGKMLLTTDSQWATAGMGESGLTRTQGSRSLSGKTGRTFFSTE